MRKSAPDEIAGLAGPVRRQVAGWKQLTERWPALTERARRALYAAREEAARLGERYVGTEHLLLGLLNEEESVASRVLAERLALPLDRVRAGVEARLTRGEESLLPPNELTPRARKVIDLAHDEAQAPGQESIGTEHLLLGLLREEEGCGGQVLRELGADLDRARQETLALRGAR